ncbi:hypothetical protein EVB55_234 [Rhizobium phage RHph_Y68]|uniref:Uncharacterized protein n=1 Tax=Rhizobium phage RHph_Y68 TaxID=2509787 RepID=A0A7S5UT19_9CAUD|nr:hypothetical protein PP934_gp234 [Rhizobium phage RHph_Y68]QIG68169.1 hypothetical protein EVB55_234 [Rhizobium phage RHph_Y68]
MSNWVFMNGDAVLGVVLFALIIWHQVRKGANVIKEKK